MYYVLIKGPSYGGLDFESRERIRETLREQLEGCGVRFQEYHWIWDEKDRCLLLAGCYMNLQDAYWWLKALRSMEFELSIRTHLPGDEPRTHCH